MVLIYYKQWLLLFWMLTFSWFSFDMSRDLWDRFIEDRECSCPVWWSSSIRKISTTEEGRSTYKSSLIFTHIVYRCVRLSCPYFQEGLCVCKRDGLPANHHWYSLLNWRVLIATCKQLVWSIRIGRNIPIWVLCLILGSGPGAILPLEVTGSCSRAIGTWSPRSSTYRAVCVPSVDIPTPRTHTSTVYRAVSQVPPHLAASMVITQMRINNIT